MKRSARCYAILDKLGARERAAFVLRYMEERTLEEVATGLGVSLSTAKRLVSRSSERVSKHVGNDEGLRSFFDRREGATDRPPGKREHHRNHECQIECQRMTVSQMEGAPGEAAPGESAIGAGGAVVSRLPAPPNARVDGIDARSAGLAAFVVSEVEAPAASVQASAPRRPRSCSRHGRGKRAGDGRAGRSAPALRWGR